MKVIDSFSGDYRFLSNFYPCSITYETVKYPSVEHAYQAAKTKDTVQRLRIAAASTATVAKLMGRRLELPADWDKVKIEIMTTLVTKKFRYADLRQRLIDTGNAKLIEGNTWGDTFWGVYQGKGSNHLGRILMAVRDKVKG